MCGINGIFGRAEGAGSAIERMNEALSHRGPDAAGVYLTNSIALGHRRLSIIDLTTAANQPMTDPSGRYTLVFNGEIYNYQELRAQIAEYPFATKGDTEVLLAGLCKEGIAFLQKCNGMFAFAFWDAESEVLLLGRDRLGIKPLYYSRSGANFIFSSEIRALLKSGFVEPRVNPKTLPEYLRYQTVHGENTLVSGIFSIPPGHTLELNEDGEVLKPYWHALTHYDTSLSRMAYPDVLSLIRSRLSDAVERRLIADVPFGAFLSGGIDSSAVVGLASEHASHPIKTFTVTFGESAYSEGTWASQVARHFSTDHTELRLEAGSLLSDLPQALSAADHPGGDGVNTWVVSKAARQAGITMVLSGLGGDELFAGYPVFKQIHGMQDRRWLLSFPAFMRKAGAMLSTTRQHAAAKWKVPAAISEPYFDVEYLYRYSRAMMPSAMIDHLLDAPLGTRDAVFQLVQQGVGYGNPGFNLPLLSKISFAEISTYLESVLLRDADQMGMAHALEIRVPFLDHTLVEAVLGIPDAFKYPHTPKKLLTDALQGLLPEAITNRPKMGFTFPWDSWMRHELKDFCAGHMHSLARRPYFRQKAVEKRWAAFLDGKGTVTWSGIWYLCALESWLSQNGIN